MGLVRYYSLKEEKRKREEEEAARQAKEAEEAARRAKEVEEAARRIREEEEAARRAREEEEAARRQKEQEEEEARLALEAEQKAAEQQEKTPLQQPTAPGKQSDEVETLVLEHAKAPVDVEIESKGRAQVVVSKDQNHSEKVPQVEAGPHPEVKEHQKQKENGSSAHPREEGTQAKPKSPEIPTGQSQNRAPSLSKLPASRSQEKRELRRQRGLEHNQRESERAASAGKDDTSIKSKTLESPGKADGKLKERSDSKELDQYTFVAWKVDKTKRDAKEVPPELVRPSTLPLDIPTSGPGRNGYTDPSITAQPALAKEEANRKKEPSRSNTQPENLIAGPRSLEDRNIKTLQYGLCSPSCVSLFISLYDSDDIFCLVFPTLPGTMGSLCH